MVADALVYHPSVAHYLKFVATTSKLTLRPRAAVLSRGFLRNLTADQLAHAVGRDKLLRTLQYFARFYAWYLYRTNHPTSQIKTYDAIKKQFGLTRKLMRVGKFVENFKAAAEAMDKKTLDPVLRYCAVGRQLGYGIYLCLDPITYVSDLVPSLMAIWYVFVDMRCWFSA
jgi:peroxin-11B